MAAASNFLEQAVLNLVFRGIPYEAPKELYVALYTGNPGEDGDGPEVEDSSYQRMPVTHELLAPTLAEAWTVPELDEDFEGHFIKNTQRIQFPPIDDVTITVTHFAIWDAPKESEGVERLGFTAEPVAEEDAGKYSTATVVNLHGLKEGDALEIKLQNQDEFKATFTNGVWISENAAFEVLVNSVNISESVVTVSHNSAPFTMETMKIVIGRVEKGNMIYYGAFEVPKTIEYSDVVSIGPEALKFLNR